MCGHAQSPCRQAFEVYGMKLFPLPFAMRGDTWGTVEEDKPVVTTSLMSDTVPDSCGFNYLVGKSSPRAISLFRQFDSEVELK